MHLSANVSTEFLSVIEQGGLLAAAQNVPVEVVEVDGVEVTRYGKTASSEAALERLTAAFWPAIAKAASGAKVVEREEAEAVALVEFVEAVRRYDLSDDVPFSATIATVLRFAVKKADRGNDLIKVKNTVAAEYWSRMYRHGGNFAAAFAEVKAEPTGLTPETFLAVHLIVSGIDPLDPLVASEDDDRAPRHAGAASVESHEERIAREAEVTYLLSLVSARQDSILRLAYGFRDVATEKIRLTHGYAIGELLDDPQIAHALGMTKPTVQRDRTKALALMLDALASATAGERA